MTALDQAFIKAFSRQDMFPLAVSPQRLRRKTRERKGRRK